MALPSPTPNPSTLEAPAVTGSALTRTSRPARRERQQWEGYLFIAPWLLGFLFFTLGPILISIYLSMTKWDLMHPRPLWIGAQNYRDLFNDPDFYLSLNRTLYYTAVSVPLGMAGSLAVAMLLNQKVPGISVFRTVYYLPAVTSSVAMFLLWRWVLNPEYGLVNYLLHTVFHTPRNWPGWLSDPGWAMPALILMNLWYLGGGMIIYLAGLQGIPQHLYEAAELDGAGAWSQFRNVTIPMLTPTIFFNLVMSVIGSFQVFTQAYVMTDGGPAKATMFYVLLLYKQAFDFLRFGYASAMAWILFIIIAVLTAFNFKVAPRWVHYE
jgi:multiple sugar transport system permease protein